MNGSCFLKIALFPGRIDEVKAKLFREISNTVHRHTGVGESNIIIYFVEVNRGNRVGRALVLGDSARILNEVGV